MNINNLINFFNENKYAYRVYLFFILIFLPKTDKNVALALENRDRILQLTLLSVDSSRTVV